MPGILEELIGRVIMPLLQDTSYDAWAVQTDGRVIFDTTAEEIGKNLFTDPAYQSVGLQEAFKRVVAEHGTESYTDPTVPRTATARL